MQTNLTPKILTRSVIAVPPLARNADFSLCEPENRKIIRHMEAGGVQTLLYGGNANLYHLPPADLDELFGFLAESAGAETLVIPSVGPTFGLMIEQAKIVRRHRFPTVMLLPQVGITTADGVEEGVRRFVHAAGVPVLLYIKHDGYIEPANVRRLANDKLISGIKYATVRPDLAEDEYLTRLIEQVDPNIIISGIGEQPAIIHLQDFKLGGFTSGCVCIAPRLSVKMLTAIRTANWKAADIIRTGFKPLEDLRNRINPIRVLHEAVRLAGLADTGPLMPLLSNLEPAHHPAVRDAAIALRELDRIG